MAIIRESEINTYGFGLAFRNTLATSIKNTYVYVEKSAEFFSRTAALRLEYWAESGCSGGDFKLLRKWRAQNKKVKESIFGIILTQGPRNASQLIRILTFFLLPLIIAYIRHFKIYLNNKADVIILVLSWGLRIRRRLR